MKSDKCIFKKEEKDIEQRIADSDSTNLIIIDSEECRKCNGYNKECEYYVPKYKGEL